MSQVQWGEPPEPQPRPTTWPRLGRLPNFLTGSGGFRGSQGVHKSGFGGVTDSNFYNIESQSLVGVICCTLLRNPTSNVPKERVIVFLFLVLKEEQIGVSEGRTDPLFTITVSKHRTF